MTLRSLIIAGVVVLVPISAWYAWKASQLEPVTFEQAVEKAESSTEGEQAPKVLLPGRVERPASPETDGMMLLRDAAGASVRVSYSGSTPERPFTAGQSVRFVGHVHGGKSGYFHATQVFE